MTSQIAEPGVSVTKPPIDSSDAAWASVPTPLTTGELTSVCQDIEVLFRLNPYYSFKKFSQSGPATWSADFENHSNQTSNQLELTVSRDHARAISVQYSQGIKKRTVFAIEPAGPVSKLVLTDDYEGLTAAEREQRLAEVDKSLAAWGEALRVYCIRIKRWSWLPGWRWYIRRVWIPMKPSARRIVWWLFLISVAEFFFFLFVMLIYVIEQG